MALCRVLEYHAGEFRRNLRFLPRAVKKFRHKGQIHGRLFPDRNRKGFRRGIHMVNGFLLVDGALKEHIRLALQLAVLVQHFQRTEQAVRTVLFKSQFVSSAANQPIFSLEAVISGIQFLLKVCDGVLRPAI